jgi:phosphate starvation-inducible protein PhoH
MRKDKTANYNRAGSQLVQIKPMTRNQELMLASEKHLVAHGSAGTGKTFLATYSALDDILRKKLYKHLTYIRSAVPTRNLGFLPGTEKEKSEAYESPYKDIANELMGGTDVNAYDKLKNEGKIRFMTTSFIRGSTLNDCVLIVDECQNMSFHELDTIITRVGQNCKIFFCGDGQQNGDLGKEESGLGKFSDILRKMGSFDFIEFGIDDVVRSGLVKEYLVAKYRG